jgi:hypothetical protein
MKRLADIARRREQLIARAAVERAAAAASFRGLKAPLGIVDRVVGAAYFVRAHPLLVGTGVAVIVATLSGKLRMLPALGRGLAAWRLWRTVSGLSGWLIDRQRTKGVAAR